MLGSRPEVTTALYRKFTNIQGRNIRVFSPYVSSLILNRNSQEHAITAANMFTVKKNVQHMRMLTVRGSGGQ